MGVQNQIKVDTEQMMKSANELERVITKIQNNLNNLERKVNSIDPYWDGEGANTHLESFNNRIKGSEYYISNFLNCVDNLRTAAGIYKKTEDEVINTNKGLIKDVLDD